MATINLTELKSFPTAKGFGSGATGGRGGNLVYVTNLNNSGVGSFRDAIENNTGPRTIIFRVAGYIDLSSYVTIDDGDVTIAGETAPGDGITLRGYGLQIRASNVIVRHLRARTGKQYSNTKGFRIVNNADNTTIENIIIDHCSSSWGTDENLAFANYGANSKIQNATVQNCIISENMGSGAILMMNEVINISFYQNYLANNSARMLRPSTSGPRFEGINNIFYNYVRGTEVSYDCEVDMIGNVYKNGDNVTATGHPIMYQSSSNTPGALPEDGVIYQTDNVKINNAYSLTNSTWATYENAGRAITDSPLTPYSSSMVVDSVLADVGKYPHDAVDKRLIGYYSSGGGILISDEATVGGYPTLSAGSLYPDSNNDGISDSWASTHGISSASQVKSTYTIGGHTINNNAGYTALEIFLADMAGDFDLLAGEPGVNIPVITLTGASTINLNVGDAYTELGATATDVEDGNLTGSIVVTGTVNTAVAGTYYKYYNVTDSNSNAAVQVVRTIIVSEPGAVSNKTGVHKNLFWSI